MFELVVMELEHIKGLIEEPMNFHLRDWYDSGWAEKLKQGTEAFSVLVNGEVMLCGGISPMWPGRGYLWTVLSSKIKEHSVATYRGLKLALFEQPYNRIEMDVPVDLEIAHRRARYLGFSLEVGRARKYLADGSDRSLYAWVRE